MRKLFLIIWIFFLFSLSTQVWAAEETSSCPIEDTASSLTDYIKNVRKVVTNINKELWSAEADQSKLNNTWNDISRIFNEILVWDGYFTDYSYYLIFPMFNNIPQPINRDLQLLENETNWLKKYLKSTVKRGYSSIPLSKDKICSGIENCKLWWSASDVLWEILQNHIRITTLYKQIVTEPTVEHDWEFILTIQDSVAFIDDLESKYGKTTIETCWNSEEEFWARMEKSINKITKNFEDWEDGIEKWREAWKLLVWAVNWKTPQDTEIKLLRKELARQWVPANMSAVLEQNLKDFNSDNSYSLDNNFIENSFDQIFKAWIKIANAYNKATENLFWKDDTAEQNKKAIVWIENLSTEEEKIAITGRIEKRLDIIYNKHNNFAAIDSYATSQVILNIIKMHKNIEDSSEILREAAKFATKNCNSQWKWKWNCQN